MTEYGILRSALAVFVISVFFTLVYCDIIVETSYGKIRGVQKDESIRFLGIPYATPPLGNLRWRSPVKASPWTPNVLNATLYGPACPQKYCNKYLPALSCPDVVFTSENCLYMNIWTPLNATGGSNIPVMVFFHGGAFKFGFASAPLYDGNNLVKNGNVILVNVEYRLGLLGFLYSGDGPDDSHGNFGIQDQRMALQWVQDNIANFGGNKNMVTVFGQSAGAQSVAIHMTSPKSAGLFNNAIIESAPVSVPYRDKKDALELYNTVRKLLSCPENDMACMRSKTTDEVNEAQQKSTFRVTATKLFEFVEPIGPVLDDVDVTTQPMTGAAKGLYENIPTMIGSVTEEGRMFVYAVDKLTMEKIEYEAALFAIDPSRFDEMEILYPLPKNESDCRDQFSQLISDYLFTCGIRNVSRNFVNYTDGHVYRYVFDHASKEHGAWGIDYWCEGHVCHAAELSYIFQNNPTRNHSSTPDEVLLSDIMMSYWTNFAHTADPNVGPRTMDMKWVPYLKTSNKPTIMHFVTPQNNAFVDYRKNYCDFWDSVGYAA